MGMVYYRVRPPHPGAFSESKIMDGPYLTNVGLFLFVFILINVSYGLNQHEI